MKKQSLPETDYQTRCIEAGSRSDRKICKFRFYLYICNANSLITQLSRRASVICSIILGFFYAHTIGGCLLRKLLNALRGSSQTVSSAKRQPLFPMPII